MGACRKILLLEGEEIELILLVDVSKLPIVTKHDKKKDVKKGYKEK